MSDSIDAKTAARERLFDAVLADAVAAAGGVAPTQRRPHWALIAAVLLAALVTIGVALLHAAARRDQAQEPERFDPLFPRIERRFHRDQEYVQLRSVDRVRQLPPGPLPPVAVLPSQPNADEPVPLAVLEALLSRGGVRSLTIGGDSGLPMSSWRAIAALPDLEELSIECEIEAEGMRELRHAPRLRAIAFGKVQFRVGKELVDAVLELPRLDSVSLVRQELPSPALAALAGLPGLQSLYIEGCTTGPDWLEAIAGVRSLRWLGLAVGRFENGSLTAADLRRLGALPRLESLALAKVDIAAADYAALPDSLQVVRLPDSVSAAVVRELLARPKLRGLSVGGVDPETESVLCELLPTARLERFGINGALSDPLWRALERMPRLRHLSFRGGRDVGSSLERVVHLEQLEHLECFDYLPTPEQLRCLRVLPGLRRIVMSRCAQGSQEAVDLEALQQALGAGVDLIVR